MPSAPNGRAFMTPLLTIMVLALSPLTAATPAHEDSELRLIFGVYTSEKATAMYRQFTPIIESLSETMEVQIGRPVDIEMKIYKTYDSAIDALVDGKVDFVRFGPAPYVLAKKRNPGIELLAMEGKKGKKRFQGAIVVPTSSSAKTLADLKGKRFAFGDRNSTIGRYLAQSALIKAGIDASKLSSFAFLGRHDRVVKAVEMGDFDAGAAKLSTVKKLNKKGKLRVLHVFDNVTKPWVARAKLDPGTRSELSKALLSLDDPKVLKAFKVSGFLPARDAEYALVREGMNRSAKFEKR